MKKLTHMMHAMTSYQEDTVLDQEPRRYQRLRTVVNDVPEQQQQNMLISQKRSDQKTEQQQHTLHKELKKKAKFVHLGCQKARARKAQNVHSNLTRQRKDKAKGISSLFCS